MAVRRVQFEDRVKIEAWWTAGWTFEQIAEGLGRSLSVVWREVQRNNSHRHGPKNPLAATRKGLYRWGYCARWAQHHADQRARRPRTARLARPGLLRTVVLGWLRQRWSPQQIAARSAAGVPRPAGDVGVARDDLPGASTCRRRGNLRAELTRQVALRSRPAARRPQTGSAGAARSSRPWTRDLNITSRPAEADDRAVPGHWEGDLLIGARRQLSDRHPGRTRHPLRHARRAARRPGQRPRHRRAPPP